MHQIVPRRAVLTARATRSFFWRTVIACVVGLAAVALPPHVIRLAQTLTPEPAHRVLAYTVTVKVAKREDNGELTWQGNGSGTVIFTDRGYSLVLSNHHVVAEGNHFLVIRQLHDEEGHVIGETYAASRIVHFSKHEDLVLLRVDYQFPAAARLASRLPSLSTPVVSVGAQWGETPFFTKGELTRFLPPRAFHVTAPILRGTSGGGYYVRNAGRYYLIGVPTWMIGRAYALKEEGPKINITPPHLGIGISIERVREFLAESPEFAHFRAEPP